MLEWSKVVPIGLMCPYCGAIKKKNQFRGIFEKLTNVKHDFECKLYQYKILAGKDQLYKEQFDQLMKDLQG